MSINYQTTEELEFDEKLEKVLDTFILKLICALVMDFIGLLITFLLLDFSLSSYIFGLNIITSIFSIFHLEQITYPLRGIIGTFGIILIMISFNILGCIIVGIKEKRNPLFYIKQSFIRYFLKIKDAKFKRK